MGPSRLRLHLGLQWVPSSSLSSISFGISSRIKWSSDPSTAFDMPHVRNDFVTVSALVKKLKNAVSNIKF